MAIILFLALVSCAALMFSSSNTNTPLHTKTSIPTPSIRKSTPTPDKKTKAHPGGWCHTPGKRGIASNGNIYTCTKGHWRK